MTSLKTSNFVFIIFLFSIQIISSKSIPLHQKQNEDTDSHYSILFDGGSKGTRMYVYSFKFDQIEGKASSIEQRIYCELLDDGLSTYTSPGEIAPKFENCMDEAAKIVPLEKRNKTYIGLFATAGMRLLEIKNKPLSDQLINGVRLYFQGSGYLYTNPNQVQILPGKEEAVYAWIGANFISNNFQKNQADTFSIIDLGGSSSQIAFQVPNDYPIMNNENVVQFKINNQEYNVYAYSHLCYGTTSFLNMYHTYTLRTENYADPVKESCLPTGYNIKNLGDDFLNQPCVNGMMFNFENYPFTLDTSLVKPTKNYDFDGNSKKNKCRDEVGNIIPEPTCAYGDKECSVNGVYQPSVSSLKFLALGNFFEAIDYTEKLLNIRVQNDMNAFNEATYTICSMTYTQLMDLNKLNNANLGKNRIAKLCLEHVYILKLLKLYNITTLDRVDALEQINGNKISWILGFLINELNSDKKVLF